MIELAPGFPDKCCHGGERSECRGGRAEEDGFLKEELVVDLKSQVAGLLKDKESISKTAEAGRLCIWQLHRVAVLSLRSSPNYVWQAGMLGRQMQALEASKGADSARQAMASFRAELEKANSLQAWRFKIKIFIHMPRPLKLRTGRNRTGA